MSYHLEEILLVGTGKMGKEYGKILNHLGYKYGAVTRSEESALSFFKEIGVAAQSGGLEKYIETHKNHPPSKAIVTVNVEQLKQTGNLLIDWGVKEILLEKPGGVNSAEVMELKTKAEMYPSTHLYIGYNRRFYQSVEYLLNRFNQGEKIQSIHFNFTELSHVIQDSHFPNSVKDNWLFANSSHVIDLAFFIAGFPVNMKHVKMDHLSWHPKGAAFAGCGTTEKNVLFSYHADWRSPGRWEIEVMTKDNKYILMPLEKLFVQKKGSFQTLEVGFSSKIDMDFKAGLYNQTKSFLTDKRKLVTIEEQIHISRWIAKIAE
ncbi:myo-inositol 2-dehydrogenase [Bacillus cereus]|nr:myo-inositol 2-dehydrogenase [Bacillus cereus]